MYKFNSSFLDVNPFWTLSISNLINIIFKLLKHLSKSLKWKEEKTSMSFLCYSFYNASSVFILCLVHPSFLIPLGSASEYEFLLVLFSLRGMNGKCSIIFTHALHHTTYACSYVIRNLFTISKIFFWFFLYRRFSLSPGEIILVKNLNWSELMIRSYGTIAIKLDI